MWLTIVIHDQPFMLKTMVDQGLSMVLLVNASPFGCHLHLAMWLKGNLNKLKLTLKQCSPAAFGCRKLSCSPGGLQGHFVMPILNVLLSLDTWSFGLLVTPALSLFLTISCMAHFTSMFACKFCYLKQCNEFEYLINVHPWTAWWAQPSCLYAAVRFNLHIIYFYTEIFK